jgi:hypothetical protein
LNSKVAANWRRFALAGIAGITAVNATRNYRKAAPQLRSPALWLLPTFSPTMLNVFRKFFDAMPQSMAPAVVSRPFGIAIYYYMEVFACDFHRLSLKYKPENRSLISRA